MWERKKNYARKCVSGSLSLFCGRFLSGLKPLREMWALLLSVAGTNNQEVNTAVPDGLRTPFFTVSFR